ncbi:cytochrome P450, putative [Ixodes scapularis]|uniref:Cytochrome P450, putative n=1 Tax=Ixodes scapularis TaxID=6945 RepID=B7P2B0_IXOSC|nr:cytochrome P450, putative [Ixodes scapularis]|eukprot:XP_002401973.1 cytochrome P450, putative [Ixodes scapularis]
MIFRACKLSYRHKYTIAERSGGLFFSTFIFFFCSFETASAVLTFTAYLLAKHQRIQDRLRAEIASVMERDCHFTYDNVFAMRYLDQVISESMRIYTPFVGFITRTCQREYNYNGLKIPAGLSILIPAFSPENRGMINPMAFQPFGNGPRNCVGIRFAQLEMKLTLAKLLAKFRIKLDERHIKEDHLKLGSTFIFSYPQDGVWLEFEEI